jgi:hypothetical protein
MKIFLLSPLLVVFMVSCGRSSPPTDSVTTPGKPPTLAQEGTAKQEANGQQNLVAGALATVTETAQATVAEMREHAGAAMTEVEEQIQAVAQQAQDQARSLVADVQQQAQTFVTQMPAELQQVSTQAQTRLESIAASALELGELSQGLSARLFGETNRTGADTEATDPTAQALQVAPAQSEPATRLETNVVTSVTNAVQEVQKAINRLFPPRRNP